MRVFGKDCGCDSRREIMFDAGHIGAMELAILGACVALLAVAWRGKP